MGDISELKFDDKNFNKHTPRGMSLLEKSLNQFGAGRSILVDKDSNIIAGNGIVEAAANAGITKTKVIETDGTELVVVKRKDVELNSDQGREMALADNATAASDLEWDADTMGEFFDSDKLAEWDVELDFTEPEKEIVEDEAPEPEAETTTKLGDVFILGGHKVMCGDSTKKEDMDKLMGGGSLADLWLTDPPYNIDYHDKTKSRMAIENDKMESNEFRAFLEDAFTVAHSHLKDGGVFYIWYADTETVNFRSACESVGLSVRECLIWNKNSLVLSHLDYHWKHEPCLYGWKEGGHKWYGDRKRRIDLSYRLPK